MSQSFQQQVNLQPGVGEAGDFADANIRATVITPTYLPGVALKPGFVADATYPCIVGNFAWGDQLTGFCASRYNGKASSKLGFVHRENQTIITQFLGQSVLALQPGLIATIYDQGSFWAKFAAGATVGQSVFANYLDGSVYSAASNHSTQDFSATLSTISSGGVLDTTGGSVTGTVKVGDVLAGTGVGAGVSVTSQISGTVGGAGTYQTTYAGAGVSSTTITGAGSVKTNFLVDSPASAGELAKISTWG